MASHGDTFDHYAKASVIFKNVLHVESEGGQALNEETGMIPVFRGSYFKRFDNGIFVELSAQQSSETLDYDGYSQLNTRFQTESEYYITGYRAKIGRKALHLASYLGVDSHYRERNIKAAELDEGFTVLGLYEEFELKEVFLGFDFFMLQDERKHLKLTVEGAGSVDGSMYVEFSGTADPKNIDLGQAASLYLGLEWFYSFANGFALSLEPAYKYTRMEASDDYPYTVNGESSNKIFRQPTTEIQEFSLGLSVSRRF